MEHEKNLPYQFHWRPHSVDWEPQLSNKKMKKTFLWNMSKSQRLTSTFFPMTHIEIKRDWPTDVAICAGSTGLSVLDYKTSMYTLNFSFFYLFYTKQIRLDLKAEVPVFSPTPFSIYAISFSKRIEPTRWTRLSKPYGESITQSIMFYIFNFPIHPREPFGKGSRAEWNWES